MSRPGSITARLCGVIRVRREEFLELRGRAEVAPVAARIPVAFERVTAENVARAGDFREARLAKAFRRYLREGQEGIFAVADGRVVGHAWAVICRGGRCLANGYIELARGEAALHSISVAESHRGRRVFQAMVAAFCARLFDEANVGRIVSTVELDNPASRRGHMNIGFRSVGRQLCVMFRRWLLFRKKLGQEAGEDD